MKEIVENFSDGCLILVINNVVDRVSMHNYLF
jgi:hypothetical protein